MATKNIESAKSEKQTVHEAKGVSGNQKEALYSLEEFVANAETAFNTSPECVFAALKQSGITECTKSKAAEIVKAFRRREVK